MGDSAKRGSAGKIKLEGFNDLFGSGTDYIVPIHASVERGNTFACQFHPEKSGDVGLKILQNFSELA